MESAPIAVLPLDHVINQRLLTPTIVLLFHVVLDLREPEPIAILLVPEVLFLRADSQSAIFPPVLKYQTIILFLLNTRFISFVLPIKSFTPIVFPERDQSTLPPAAAQRAFPEASEVRI